MPARIINSQYDNNDQVAYAHYVGNAPTAPSAIYDVSSTEAAANTSPSTYGASYTPLVNATYIGKEPEKKDTPASAQPFLQALGSQTAPIPQAYTQPQNTHPATTTTPTVTTTTTSPIQYPSNTVTGNEYLALLKQERKQKTVTAGVVGGVIGCILLGPLGAVAFGWGNAAITKKLRKRQERILRAEFERQGRLDTPIVTIPMHLRRQRRR